MFMSSIRTFSNIPNFKFEQNSTHRKPAQKLKKFSAFGTDKEYKIEPDRMLGKDLKDFPKFEPKEEFSKTPFNEHVRNRIDQIPNHLIERFMYGSPP